MISRSRSFSMLTRGIALMAISSLCAVGDDQSQPHKRPTPAAVRQSIADLGASTFAKREAAIDELISAGKAAIAPLAVAVMSSDPEVAWRAATALEAIGLEGDEATLAEIKRQMEKLKGMPHRDLAMVLSTLSQRWTEMQQIKAQTALVKLGAQFPSSPTGLPGAPGGAIIYSGAGIPVYSKFSGVTFGSATTTLPPSFPATAAPATSVEFDPFSIPMELRSLLEETKEIEKRLEEAGEEKIESKDGPKPSTDKSSAEAVKEKASDEATKSKPAEEKTEKSEKGSATEKRDEAADSKPSKEEPAPDEPKAEVTFETLTLTAPTVITSDSFLLPPAYGGGFLADASELPMASGIVQLNEQWRGGDKGLAHLANLANISMLDIQDAPITDKAIEHFLRMPALANIMIRGTKMTPESLMKLAKAKPGLTIRGQSRGVLGINSGDESSACVVSALRPGAPAEAAGIKEGDLITKIDGKEVSTFGHLTLLMMKKEPGDEVKITLKRGDETLEKKFKLGNRDDILR